MAIDHWRLTAAPFGRARVLAGLGRWLMAAVQGDSSIPWNNAIRVPLPSSFSPEAFEQFFRRHERRIFTYLCRMTGNEQSAYDLGQETFVRAWQHFDEIQHYEKPESWLYRVATNLALNHLRREQVALSITMPLDDADVGGDDPATHVAEQESVVLALLRLSPKQRALLVLREVYGLSCEEAGQILGLSLVAARKTLFRARERFRTVYRQGE